MIANKWYCIAQTGTFDSGCTITVSFDSYSIQFSASVKYGATAINVTSCDLPIDINLSLRLRESDGHWSVDLLSDKEINTNITVADSPYWAVVNSVAGAGNVILSLNNISREFNTGTSGGGGGLNENELRAFLDKYGYTRARDFWTYENIAGGALHTGYNIIVDGGGAFGGTELGGGGEGGGGGISEFYIQIGEGGQKYKLGNSGLPNVVLIPKYPVVPTNVSEFFNDAGYIGGEEAAAIHLRINGLENRVSDLEKLWWVDENGNLHTTYNIVVEKGGAFGTGASVDAGGGGGLGRVVLVNDSGNEFSSDENGIVRIPDYVNKAWFDAQKYITETWVLNKGYITDASLQPIREDVATLKDDVSTLKGMWTIKDGKLYTEYSIVVEGGGAFGAGANPEGGSSGGLGSVILQDEKGNMFKSDSNGVVLIPAWATESWVNGQNFVSESWVLNKKYATEDWVLGKKYITDAALTPYATLDYVNKTFVTLSGNETITGAKTFSSLITANGGVTIPASKSLKIGDIVLTQDGTALKISGNLVVTGGGAFGEGASAGGGTTGGLGQIIIKNEAGQEYKTDANGVVVIPTYLTSNALDGYATQAWVESKKYLTSHQDISHLLSKTDAANTYATQSALKGVSDSLGTLRTDFDNLNTLLNDDTSGVIDTWREVVDFIDEYSGSQDLATILAGMNSNIATNAANISKNATAITNVSNRVTALEAMWYIDADGNLHTKKSIVVEGGGAFGTGSTSGGGTSGGLGSVTIKTEGGIEYKSNSNGVVTVPNWITASALNGYATQSWVENKKYITGITSAMVTAALEYTPLSTKGGTIAQDNIAFPLIIKGTSAQVGIIFRDASGTNKGAISWESGTGTYIYNYASAAYIGVKDDGTPHYKGNVLYHAGNFTPSDYLPLSGGTITSSSSEMFVLKRTEGLNPYITFRKEDGTLLGRFGFDVNSLDALVSVKGVMQNIIHSGNYSSYALSLSGGTLTTSSIIPLYINSTNANQTLVRIDNNSSAKTGIGWRGDNGMGTFLYNYASGSYLGVKDDGTPHYNGNTLIHSGNIGSQSVSSASKAEALKIFAQQDADTAEKGKLFSTTYNTALPNGASYYLNGITLASNDDNSYRVQLAVDYYGAVFSRSERASKWYDWKKLAFITDNVASATKLETARTIWGQSFDGSANVSGNLHLDQSKIYWHSDANNYYIGTYYDGSTNPILDVKYYGGIRFFTSAAERMRIATNGNVLIGTTTDYGYKVDINGSTRISGIQLVLGNDNGGSILFQRPSANYIWANKAGGYLVFGCLDQGELGVATSSLVVTKGAVYAGATTALGTSTFKWSKIYGIDIYADGGWLRTSADNTGLYNSTGDARWYYSVSAGSWVSDKALKIGGNIVLTDKTGSSTTSNRLIFTRNTHDDDYWDYGIYAQSTKGLTFFQSSKGVDTDIAYLTGNGDLVVNGGGAFGSDVRYKDIINYTNIDLATIADAPLFTYRWTDREDKKVYLGTSAQYWLNTVFTNAVNTSNPNFYHLDYGALAVGIGISVAKEVKGVKTEVEQLKEEVKQLKEKLNKYEQIWHN